MFLFLQNLRATLIPTIAVPVVLLGTFGVLATLGFSINMLTMFAMVLAIGLLVDDAIVVVENVERLMSEEGLSPLEATRKSMEQITGALVGIGLVLSAVFVPMAFMSGSVGVIYRQFSATIVSAMALSVLVAIVLTPALCATLLKPLHKGEHYGQRGFFRWFNARFDAGSRRYRAGVRSVLARPGRFLAIFALLVVAMAVLYARLPGAFLPDEDQGSLIVQVVTPAGATQQRTMKSIEAVERHFLEDEKDTVASLFTVQGFSFSGSGQNNGMGFVRLKDWEERDTPEQHVRAVARRAMGALGQIKDAFAFAFVPPAVTELGRAAGFAFHLQDRGRPGPRRAGRRPATSCWAPPGRASCWSTSAPTARRTRPSSRSEVDNEKAAALGLRISDINATLSTAWGGRYIDDFIDRGRVKRVYLQADAPCRMNPEDFRLWSVRNDQGQMVPFSAFASWNWGYGSPRLERFNGVPSMEIQGESAPGVSTGEAMGEVERLVASLPPGFGIEWSGVSYQEREAGAQTPLLYTLSLAIVFLCLAALYESWSIPDRSAAGGAARHPRGRAGQHAARHAARRVLPGRDAGHRRADQQERDPDRGVREVLRRGRHGPDRGDHAGGARPPAPDPDDLAGLRPRRAAAGAGLGCRLGRAARHRHRRAGRHDRRHRPRAGVHPAVLRGGGTAVRAARAGRDGHGKRQQGSRAMSAQQDIPSVEGTRAEAQRERILGAAQKCFIESGFHAASMASIAETAGMSAGLMYRYFENKSAIVLAIIERQLADAHESLSRQKPASDLAADLFALFRGWQARDPSVMNAALYLEMSAEGTRDPQVAAAVRAADAQLHEDLKAWVARPREQGGLGLPADKARRARGDAAVLRPRPRGERGAQPRTRSCAGAPGDRGFRAGAAGRLRSAPSVNRFASRRAGT